MTTSIEKAFSAIHDNNIKALQELLTDIDVNSTNKDNFSLLMKASAYGHLDIVKLLVKNGANVNQSLNLDGKRIKGFALVAATSLSFSLNIVKFLVKNGADITAYKSASLRGSFFFSDENEEKAHKIREFLVKNGADVNAKRRGSILDEPLIQSTEKGLHKTTKMLVKNGANIMVKRNQPIKNAINGNTQGHKLDKAFLLKEYKKITGKSFSLR